MLLKVALLEKIAESITEIPTPHSPIAEKAHQFVEICIFVFPNDSERISIVHNWYNIFVMPSQEKVVWVWCTEQEQAPSATSVSCRLWNSPKKPLGMVSNSPFHCRKPLYYIFNLVLPAVFITATTILVFYLPAASGEKVSLGVTVLLALTVFLLMVAESMPPQSDSIPLMGKYSSLYIQTHLGKYV